jgi:hypothetical protein
MYIEPTNRTAAIAGIWSSMGLVPFDAWIEQAKFGSVLTYNLMWLSGSAVFFFLPVLFFVIGRNTGAFSRAWILDHKERAAYWIVVKRMFVWFVSAGAAGGARLSRREHPLRSVVDD